MFVIVVYDVNQKRVSRVNKTCKKYLYPIQRSVFEGNIKQGQLRKLQKELENQILVEEDSVCIYKIEYGRYIYKEKIGLDQGRDYFL